MVKHPPDVLITTPESLYLMLTSGAREIFEGTETVILDEIHAVAQTKRGAHLAITLERLVEQAGRDVQRVGLSATQNPLEEVGRFMVGPSRRVTVVDTGVRKPLDLKIHVPVESMVEPENMDLELDPFAGQEATRKSIWPAIYPELLKLVREHTSTLIFVNNRRAAERLALRLNEIAEEPLARAHHGSLAREERLVVEEQLKAGELPCLVATSSLELGIDMGAIDLVLQVESPKSVTAGLQRIGRAGPQRRRHLQGPHLPQVPRRPARVRGRRAAHARGVDRDHGRPAQPARRARPADRGDGGLGRGRRAARSTCWRRCSPAPTRTPSSRGRSSRTCWTCSTAATRARSSASCGRGSSGTAWRGRSGRARARARWRSPTPGTIPDRGLYSVNLPDGRRVGELDEEMVYEARAGQVFLLGASSWRIEEITRDRVIVTPAPGVPGAVPFWKGDGLGRPKELGEAIGAFARWAVEQDKETLADGYDLDPKAASNLLEFLLEQQEATRVVPSRPHDRDRALPRRDRRLARLRPVAVRRPRARRLGARAVAPASARSTGWSRTRSGPTTASSSTSPTPTRRPARSW